ncbi:hypothetical protein TcasGA2_TC014170 [Tribolium castaneum]|uniref:Uncharacterized protein n=1 Tax=Tribolium castaneum TaxID=7070 RepID=D6W6U6_TRICA|nr:hypothetical protein TcasGA2_TC014170 [Tribolium castaneum]
MNSTFTSNVNASLKAEPAASQVAKVFAKVNMQTVCLVSDVGEPNQKFLHLIRGSNPRPPPPKVALIPLGHEALEKFLHLIRGSNPRPPPPKVALIPLGHEALGGKSETPYKNKGLGRFINFWQGSNVLGTIMDGLKQLLCSVKSVFLIYGRRDRTADGLHCFPSSVPTLSQGTARRQLVYDAGRRQSGSRDILEQATGNSTGTHVRSAPCRHYSLQIRKRTMHGNDPWKFSAQLRLLLLL